MTVPLGTRSFDMLFALASRPNQIVGKRELLSLVWPDVIVDEGSLRFHIAALRKALGDGRDGARYIVTMPGRGYCFVAQVDASTDEADRRTLAAISFGATGLPAPLARMVGREDGVEAVSAKLVESRFVTIVGPGGVGKTTVAAAVAHGMLKRFSGAVVFVDLGQLSASELVPSALASMLGLAIQSRDPTPSLIAYLRDKFLLVVLDNCEHVVDGAASLASRIFLETPDVHVLATSREAMRVEGEHVHQLVPLSCPPDEPGLTAETVRTFSAVQLFLERAEASGVLLDGFSDADAVLTASICRKLDGVALAIELAAGRIGGYGLQQTAALLDQRLTLLWQGQRTAAPRHKTLRATLDWSYELLTQSERTVLRRLAVFVGHFTIEAAIAVVASPALDEAQVFNAIDSLVAKSMVATRPSGSMMRYRLLDTTRSYALEIGSSDAEQVIVAARHADYFQRWLDESEEGWPSLSNATERAPYLAGLNNVRAALEWCFGPDGDIDMGVRLSSAAARVFLAMSLLTDCHRWSTRAVEALEAGAKGGGREEMNLYASLALSQMFTSGTVSSGGDALERSLAIAEQQGDVLDQVLQLGPLHMFHIRIGEFGTALAYARRSHDVSTAAGDGEALTLAQALLGFSLHLAGELEPAEAALRAALEGPTSPRTGRIELGFDFRNRASIALARTLWMKGHPEQAMHLARRTIADAEAMDHPMTLYIALIWGIWVFIWAGDLDTAESHLDKFQAHAESHSLGPYRAVGRGLRGVLALKGGDAEAAVDNLASCLKDLHASRYELINTMFELALIEGYAVLGLNDEGLELADRTIQRIEKNGDFAWMPELLRAKAIVLNSEAAEVHLRKALSSAKLQGARAWELRASADLAAVWVGNGQVLAARELLGSVLTQFKEGFETADLRAANNQMSTLNSLA